MLLMLLLSLLSHIVIRCNSCFSIVNGDALIQLDHQFMKNFSQMPSLLFKMRQYLYRWPSGLKCWLMDHIDYRCVGLNPITGDLSMRNFHETDC